MMNAKPFVGEGYDERNMQREVRCKNLNCNSTQVGASVALFLCVAERLMRVTSVD